jgi:hypothetical protein
MMPFAIHHLLMNGNGFTARVIVPRRYEVTGPE